MENYIEEEPEEEKESCLTPEICAELEAAMSGRCDEIIQLMAGLSNRFADAIQRSGYLRLKEMYDHCFYGDFYGYGVCVTGYAQYNPKDCDYASGLEASLNAMLGQLYWGNFYHSCAGDFARPVISVDDIRTLTYELRLAYDSLYDCLIYPLVESGSEADEFSGPAQQALGSLWGALSVSISQMSGELAEVERCINDTMRLLQSQLQIGSVLSDSGLKWRL